MTAKLGERHCRRDLATRHDAPRAARDRSGGMGRAAGLAIAFAAIAGAAWGQVPPATPYYAMDPVSPLTPRAGSPVQQQVLENYRTQLLQAQREGLQQNPSGLGRDQLQIGSQLNAFGGPATMVPPNPGPLGPPFPTIPASPLFNPAAGR
jgi:hypothetical protein